MTESQELKDTWPSLADAVADDQKRFNAAWEIAYHLLYRHGMALVRRRLAGPEWESVREDLVMTSIAKFQNKLLKLYGNTVP